MTDFKKAFIKRRSKIQNILIVILCVTVLFQVSHLWFVNLSNGQSLYKKDNKSVAQNVYKKDFIVPKRMLSSSGFNNFFAVYEDDAFSQTLKVTDKILIEASSKADFISQQTFTSDFLNKDKILIFDYSYKIDGRMLMEALNASKNNFNKIKEFNEICFSYEDGLINIYFINSETAEYFYYVLKNDGLYDDLIKCSKSIYSDITYSYNLDKNGLVFSDELIANVESQIAYNKVSSINPFTTIYGDSPRNLVESKVDRYFKNILYMKFSPSETAYVFSDTNTVVKYFNSGILEYSYYNVTPNSYEYSIVEDYAIAKNFIKDDPDIVNNFYLTSYYRNNFETVFEFSYVANNFPVHYESEDGLNDVPISITIKNNVVTNYKKIVNNFTISEETEVINKPFGDAINIFSSTADDKSINNVSLGYKATSEEGDITLYWFMDAFGSDTSLSTQ